MTGGGLLLGHPEIFKGSLFLRGTTGKLDPVSEQTQRKVTENILRLVPAPLHSKHDNPEKVWVGMVMLSS